MKHPAALILMLSLIVSNLYACTSIIASNSTTTLVGSNEDWDDPFTRMSFVKPQTGSFGKVYLGYRDSYEACLNDQGLYSTGFTAPTRRVVSSLNKKEIKPETLRDIAMNTCTTINEVVKLYKKYNLSFLRDRQLLFADKSGNSVIIEGDDFVFKKGPYQIVTNFYQSSTEEKFYNCDRYQIASEMLGTSKDISTNLFKKILSATHSENDSPTLYSGIFDLKKGTFNLYHFHDFENVRVFNLEDEFKKMGAQKQVVYEIADLFPKSFAAQEFKENYRGSRRRGRNYYSSRSRH